MIARWTPLLLLAACGSGAAPATNNTWTVQVRDAGGAALSGATLSVVPFMPRHGHGTSVVPHVTPGSSGTYSVADIYLFMAGLWQVTINAQAGAVTDVAAFGFCGAARPAPRPAAPGAAPGRPPRPWRCRS